MLCYHTELNMNTDFNEDILYAMFFEWLQNTRNIMEGLVFDNQLPFSYQIHHKRVFIQEFPHYDKLVIHFITNDNEENNRFTVEIIYSKREHKLELNFSITMADESTDVTHIAIPNIFRLLINSSYTLKDQSLLIHDLPFLRTYQEYQSLDVTKHKLPFVVLHLNDENKTCLNRFKLPRINWYCACYLY